MVRTRRAAHRDLVVVVGLIDRKHPETRDLAAALLQPLSSWTSNASSANDDADEDPVTPPAPAPPPANDATAPQRKVGWSRPRDRALTRSPPATA